MCLSFVSFDVEGAGCGGGGGGDHFKVAARSPWGTGRRGRGNGPPANRGPDPTSRAPRRPPGKQREQRL